MSTSDLWIPPFLALSQGMSDDMRIGLAEAYLKLLRMPTFTIGDLIVNGVNPETAGLLHLTNQNGQERYPVFQFEIVGSFRLRPVVQRINELLGVGDIEDAFATAQWWLCPNAWLHNNASPASQLGVMSDEELFRLAATIGEDI